MLLVVEIVDGFISNFLSYRKQSSRGGLVVERLLHKKYHSATVDRIPPSMACQSFGGGPPVALQIAE